MAQLWIERNEDSDDRSWMDACVDRLMAQGLAGFSTGDCRLFGIEAPSTLLIVAPETHVVGSHDTE